jgi:tetratricopeptide (TPR) repeat protein
MFFYPPGSHIANRYEVASRPLLGGMGIVYLCMDTIEDRPVALKTFKPEFLPDRAARDRFLREGTAWVELGSHPHIVRCYGVERIGDGREVFLVLELVAKAEGHPDASLRSWLIPGQPMPLEQALLFALQMARAMQHATSILPAFVHRDLKPENVLVGSDRLPGSDPNQPGANRLRVTDFGLAHLLEEAGEQGEGERAAGEREELPEHTREEAGRPSSSPLGHTRLTRGMVGTPLYMAPEQWLRQPVSTATDVYALGCILFEMLAGQRAADGHSLAELERQHCAGQHPPLPGGLPAEVQALLAGCLAPRPDQRPGNWDELEARLAAAYRQAAGREAPQVAAAGELSWDEQVALGWGYGNMGASYLDIGKARTAIGYFARAQAVGQAQGEPRLEAAGLNHLGLAYTDLSDARRAIGCYDQALEILRRIGNRQGEGITLGNLGSAYLALGDTRRAIGFYEQALAIDRQIGDRRNEGNALGNLGIAYAALGDARRAIGCYEQALEIDRQIGDRRGEGNALGNLGSAYQNLGDARRAIGFFEQALVISREIGDWRSEGNALGNLGKTFRDLGDISQGLSYSKQAIGVFREIGDRKAEAEELSLQGGTYIHLGDLNNATKCWQDALKIAIDIGDKMVEANCSYKLAVVFTDQNKQKQALKHAERAFVLYQQIGRTEWARDAQQLLMQLRGSTNTNRTPESNNPAQAAFEAFLHAASVAEMQAAVTQYPFMTEPGSIQAIEKVIEEQAPSEHKPAAAQRLAWLREIAGR